MLKQVYNRAERSNMPIVTIQGDEVVGGVKRKVNVTFSVTDVNVGYPQFGDVPGTVGVVPSPLTPVPEPVPGD